MSLYAMERVLSVVSHPQGAGSRAWNGSPTASGANLSPPLPSPLQRGTSGLQTARDQFLRRLSLPGHGVLLDQPRRPLLGPRGFLLGLPLPSAPFVADCLPPCLTSPASSFVLFGLNPQIRLRDRSPVPGSVFAKPTPRQVTSEGRTVRESALASLTSQMAQLQDAVTGFSRETQPVRHV